MFLVLLFFIQFFTMKKLLSIVCGLVFVFSVLTPSASASFADVKSRTRYREAINHIADLGIVKGYEDGTYQPLKNINRAEFTKIIIEAKYPGKAVGSDCFGDVGNEWFAKYVCYAKGKGIVEGNPDGTFRAGSEINTAEAYKIVFATMLDSPVYDESGEWYEKYLEYAKANDLDFSSSLNASHAVTRGEMAEMIHLVLLNNEVGEHEQAILDIVNEERRKEGLAELKYNKVLEKVAYLHAKDMFENNFFGHINNKREDPTARMEKYYEDRNWVNYKVGENIWEWEKPSSYEVDHLTNEVIYGDFGWMQSDEHKDNILSPDFKELGVGYYKTPNGKVFFVQNFGRIEF